jgi:peptidylprolyl isomerase
MAQAHQGNTVKVHYTGRLKSGEVFDSSADREPLEFTLGEQGIIPGFQEAIDGMNTGEKKTVSIASEQAYGDRHDELVIKIERERLPEDLKPEKGQQLAMKTEDDRTALVTVVDLSDTDITVDANHPLAGKDLEFDLELVEVK